MVKPRLIEAVQEHFAFTWNEIGAMMNLRKWQYFRMIKKDGPEAQEIEVLLTKFEQYEVASYLANFTDPEYDAKYDAITRDYDLQLNIKRSSLTAQKFKLIKQLAQMEERHLALTKAIHRLSWVLEHPEALTEKQLFVVEEHRTKCYEELADISLSIQLEMKAKLAGIIAELDVLRAENNSSDVNAA